MAKPLSVGPASRWRMFTDRELDAIGSTLQYMTDDVSLRMFDEIREEQSKRITRLRANRG